MLKPDIRSLQAGDGRMWETAFYWLWPIACGAAQRHLGNSYPADVEDVAVASITEAAELVGRVSSFEELKALTGVISSRKAVDHVRRMRAERRGGGKVESIEGREDLAAERKDPLAGVEAAELAKVLVDLMDRLPENHRKLLQAYYLEGMKQAELAERFGMPMGTVGVTLSRALKALRAELARHPRLLKELQEPLR